MRDVDDWDRRTRRRQAPGCITTSYLGLSSWTTVAGVAASRVSPGWASLNTPMITSDCLPAHSQLGHGLRAWSPVRDACLGGIHH